MAVMFVKVSGVEFKLVDAQDRNVLHMRAGGYETESLHAWGDLIRPHTTVVDVGAYTGIYSILAALKGADVTALEPMPAQEWRLGVNAAANKVRINIIKAAASDHNGSASMHYNPKVPLTTGASLEPYDDDDRKKVTVRCCTIDSLRLTNVSAIKLDVERHELAVLRGAMQTIERDKPTLLIETLDRKMFDKVCNLLPAYEAAMRLDTRNTLFTPR